LSAIGDNKKGQRETAGPFWISTRWVDR